MSHHILQAFNKIESIKEMYKLLRYVIDQQFHIIYEHAVLMSEKLNVKPNIP